MFQLGGLNFEQPPDQLFLKLETDHYTGPELNDTQCI